MGEEATSPSSTIPTEIEEMKARVAEMEAEAEKLRQMQSTTTATPSESTEAKEDIDSRSVYIGNVDYSTTPEDIQSHFSSCGTINRVTIICDKHTGNPKGFAYVEFAEPGLVQNALMLNETVMNGRPLKVIAKRTNLPAFQRGFRGGRRGRARGRAPRGRGGYRGRGASYAPY